MITTRAISHLTDKSRILAYLETDRLYAAYAIGDLEPHLFAQTRWVGAEKDGRLRAIVLHFRGLELPVLFLMGDTDGLRATFEGTRFPERAYVTCRGEHLAMTHEFYAWEERIPMWRMVLEPASFRPVKGDCVRLTPAHSDQLTALYTLGGGTGFSTRQLRHGVFYGVFADGRLVATAGTHVLSPTFGVAAVGNVFTHPDYRGQGYGGDHQRRRSRAVGARHPRRHPQRRSRQRGCYSHLRAIGLRALLSLPRGPCSRPEGRQPASGNLTGVPSSCRPSIASRSIQNRA